MLRGPRYGGAVPAFCSASGTGAPLLPRRGVTVSRHGDGVTPVRSDSVTVAVETGNGVAERPRASRRLAELAGGAAPGEAGRESSQRTSSGSSTGAGGQ